jgi:hypothetical protein
MRDNRHVALRLRSSADSCDIAILGGARTGHPLQLSASILASIVNIL